MSTVARMERVVPLAVKVGMRDEQRVHLGVGHLDTDGVFPSIELGLDGEPCGRAHAPNERHHGFSVDQRTPAPVLGDVTEEPVLNLVPLGRAGREMRDADGEAGAVRESLQLHLPAAGARAVAAAGVGRDGTFGTRASRCIVTFS